MQRREVQDNYKWKTEDVFESDEAWERALAELGEPDFSAYRGTLDSAENVLAYFKAEEKYSVAAMRVFLYAYLKHDEDMRESKYNSYLGKATNVLTQFGAATAFSTPELTALPDETLRAFAADPRLADYDYLLRRLIEEKKHVLSEREERVLALAGEPLDVANEVFEMLDNAELDLPEIEFEGRKTRLTHGLYSVIINGKDREKRAEAYGLFYSAYRKILRTLAATYYGNVKRDIFYKEVRGYGSCLEHALFEEDVSRDVYDNLIACVHEGEPLLHRYMRLRKRVLGYETMYMYDVAPSLVEDADLALSYEEAFDLVLKALAPLGEEYLSVLKKGRDEGWIDVCETEGKRTGAYAIGVYGMHPFVMLNYQKTTHDVFTIAHEMGHALHSWYSARQPFAKAEYKIFVAEVASTVNEVLLLKYLLSTTKEVRVRKYLLNYFIDMVRTTLFRQAQFAEFEERAHAMAEAGEPLNKDNLSELYLSLNRAYYGDAVVHDENIAIEWARVPHFYRSFYVYKYATGISAAICIADRILNEGGPAVADYLKFLSSGSSDDPVSLLRLAGADLGKKETFAAAMKEFEAALCELESLS